MGLLTSYPQWLDQEVWEAFEESRRSLRNRPFTAYAAKLVIYELQRLKDKGEDPNECLKYSIKRGYQDVYAVPKREECSGRLPDWKPEEHKASAPPEGWADKAKANIRRVS